MILCEKFEKMLAFYGAPTLAGIKDGTVISLQKKNFSEWKSLMEEYNQCLNCKGIEITTLVETERYILLFIYQEKDLAKTLKEDRIALFLQRLGYDIEASLKDKIEHLKLRMRIKKDFPHEIGLFLGFPYDDVVGFLKYNGKNFKINGYWKVYTNVYNAEQIFHKYTRCSEIFCRRLQKGESLLNLLKVG